MIQRLCVLLIVFPGCATAVEAQRDRPVQKSVARAPKSDPVRPLRVARIDGKYRMLLRQFKVDEPGGDQLVDKGFRKQKTYKGHRDLPAGHWVYARPYWFIWRDKGDARPPKRQWGPEQLIGKPDGTPGKDVATAWAAKLQDNPDAEWVMVEYETPVKATAIHIHETFHPGAISRVSIFKHDGEEEVVWRAKKIEATRTASRILKVQPPLGFHVCRVKIYLETSKVAGWNEIDAVGLVDNKGKKHWAIAAAASTTFAKSRTAPAPAMLRPVVMRPVVMRPVAMPPVVMPVVRLAVPGAAAKKNEMQRLADQVRKLAAENRVLKERMARLEKLIEQLQVRNRKK